MPHPADPVPDPTCSEPSCGSRVSSHPRLLCPPHLLSLSSPRLPPHTGTYVYMLCAKCGFAPSSDFLAQSSAVQQSWDCANKPHMRRQARILRMDTSFLRTFVRSSQASRLFARAKGAACRSWSQVCVCEFREVRRRGSLVPRRSIRYTWRECKPGDRHAAVTFAGKQSALACEDRTKGGESAMCGRQALNAGRVCAI